ncbi:tetratricopeptide repeat protein [Thermocrinis sp.]
MFKLILLFSLLTFMLGLSQIKKEFDLKVEIVAKEVEDKPKLFPPIKLTLEELKPLELSARLLQPPKELESVPVLAVKDEGSGCGKPRDAVAYRVGVDHYLAGRIPQAERELGSILTMPSNYKPMAEYVLGLIKLRQGQKDEAMNLFESSCRHTHMYKKASCELFYALSFELKGRIPENQDPFWSVVYSIKERGQYKSPNCEGVVFKKYCEYITRFVNGEIDKEYEPSTMVRRAIVLFEKRQLEQAEKILTEYSKPTKPYRDIALYYLGLIALQKNDTDRAYRHASVLENLNSQYAHSLYSQIASKSVLLARITYSLTKDERFLNMAGVIAYNNKDYQLAFSNFLEAKNIRYAVYSLIMRGDYSTAYRLLRDKKDKDREDYLWLLESSYWSGLPMEDTLEAVKAIHPDLYREYLGWSFFRKGDWSSALRHFDDPYYKAICYYNLKRYEEVLDTLQGVSHQKANILKAKSALFLNNPPLARSFLSTNSEEELYLLGLSFFMEGDYDKSIQYFRKLPNNPRALMKIGDAFYNMGKVKEAKDAYWEVLRKFPDSPLADQATLALLEVGGDKKEELIEQYLKKNPDSPYAQELKYQLADLLIERGEIRKAERILAELYEKGTELRHRALLKLASIEKDRSNKAILLYKVYKEGRPEESAQARKELIALYNELGDLQSSAELLEAGDLQEKEKATELYVKLNQWQKALSLAKELMRLGYRTPSFENKLLVIYEKTKDQDLLDYLVKSQDVNVSAKAKLEKALMLNKQNKPREALEYFVDISINNKNSSVYNTAILEGAQTFLRLGLKRDASCFLERADLRTASEKERVKIETLKKTLPKCEAR